MRSTPLRALMATSLTWNCTTCPRGLFSGPDDALREWSVPPSGHPTRRCMSEADQIARRLPHLRIETSTPVSDRKTDTSAGGMQHLLLRRLRASVRRKNTFAADATGSGWPKSTCADSAHPNMRHRPFHCLLDYAEQVIEARRQSIP